MCVCMSEQLLGVGTLSMMWVLGIELRLSTLLEQVPMSAELALQFQGAVSVHEGVTLCDGLCSPSDAHVLIRDAFLSC